MNYAQPKVSRHLAKCASQGCFVSASRWRLDVLSHQSRNCRHGVQDCAADDSGGSARSCWYATAIGFACAGSPECAISIRSLPTTSVTPLQSRLPGAPIRDWREIVPLNALLPGQNIPAYVPLRRPETRRVSTRRVQVFSLRCRLALERMLYANVAATGSGFFPASCRFPGEHDFSGCSAA